jgi:2-polyprenyl-6-methoxyphenol hydroxylase-like FAD-dependent oxidoreductase
MIRGSTAAFGYATSPEGERWWSARVPVAPLDSADLADGTPARWRGLLLPLLGADATPAADLVAAGSDRLMGTDATELPTETPWRSGRILVVGGATHAASPATGQGASMALEDAIVLAKPLRDTPDTDSALRRYETLRRLRVEHDITVSGGLSRGTPTPSGTGPSPRGAGANRAADDELVRQPEWSTDIWRLRAVDPVQRPTGATPPRTGPSYRSNHPGFSERSTCWPVSCPVDSSWSTRWRRPP